MSPSAAAATGPRPDDHPAGATPTQPPVLLLMGPTAAGKTALALAIAERCGAEVVSVDSAAVYRDMEAGTAKPSSADRARVRHHLIDVIDPLTAYSAARFRSDALAAIADIHARGRRAVLAGPLRAPKDPSRLRAVTVSALRSRGVPHNLKSAFMIWVRAGPDAIAADSDGRSDAPGPGGRGMPMMPSSESP